MKAFTLLTDPVYVKPDREYTRLQKFFRSLIKDERDLPFVYLTIRITLTLIPLAILLYIPGVNNWIWWTAAVAYLVLNNLILKGPYILMLHCTSHRAFFERKYNWLNHYLPWVLGPFFGQSPETYYSHHIGMHHPENNMPDDDSCTMFFQRDSLRGFAKYFGSFFFAGIFHLASYFIRKNRKNLLKRAVRGEILFIAMCVGLCFVNWPATLVVFIIPFAFSRVVMMMGNWAQHAFICASEPDNPYKNSITCINSTYNRQCWNDGYHIGHHLKPSMHWTDYPHNFRQNLDVYVANDAVVFEGIDYMQIFLFLMLKRYDLLAKHFVNIGNRYNSDAEVISFLKQRTRRFPAMAVASKAAVA